MPPSGRTATSPGHLFPHARLIPDWGLAHSRCSIESAAWLAGARRMASHRAPCSLWFFQSPSQLWGIGGLGRISLPTGDELHLSGSSCCPALRVGGKSPTTLLGSSILGQQRSQGGRNSQLGAEEPEEAQQWAGLRAICVFRQVARGPVLPCQGAQASAGDIAHFPAEALNF